MKSIKIGFVIAFTILISVGYTTLKPVKPSMLILQFEGYHSMKSQTELLFKKGWKVKQVVPYNDGQASRMDFIVIYEK